MSTAVVDAMMLRVAAHCHLHGLNEFTFVLHGGEPMIAKPAFYRYFVETARRTLGQDIRPLFAMQTNGTLVSDDWCSVFKELGIRVSFSLDGPKEINDRLRVDKQGRGSFDRVMAGWRCAKANGLEPGLLMVVDIHSDPGSIYDLILDMAPSTVDFLLPDATYDKLPPGLAANSPGTPYADWLLAVFELWFVGAEHREVPKIRFFLQIMRGLMGEVDGYDVIGKGKIEVLVIESDGEIQPLDGLRYCDDGIVDTNLTVLRHELDEAYNLPLIRLYHGAHDMLAPVCKSCEINEICGGGFLPHRYKSGVGFDHPSLYCRDLYKLITTVESRMMESISLTL